MQLYRASNLLLFSTLLRSANSFSPPSPFSSFGAIVHNSSKHNSSSHSITTGTSARTSIASSRTSINTSTMTSQPDNSTIPKVSISDAFDGGNGNINRIETINDQLTVYVDMKNDPFTELEQVHHSQYFSFRSTVKGSSGKSVKYVLANAGDASYPSAWEGSTTFCSTTPSIPSSWRRKLDTSYDTTTGELSWTHEHDSDSSSSSIYFAYFPPFSYDRHLHLIAQCEAAPSASVESLGQTLDGREMECITVGTGDKICWIIHRQHPGENMAEFYAEGLLTRLLGLGGNDYAVDGQVRDVLKMFTFYIVPNMCPDGAFRGHLRTNAQGQNLNREWCSTGSVGDDDYYEAPTLKRSPEVYHILKKMDETGCDAFLDVHGDEELPFNFLAGGEGCPNWGPRLKHLHGAFLAKYSRVNSDMQVPVGYNPEDTGNGRMNVCSNQITSRFNCFAATLEMPFKDCMSNPDPERGWNGARAAMLGSSVLEALAYVGPFLRLEDEKELEHAFDLVKDDAYVRPSADYKSIVK